MRKLFLPVFFLLLAASVPGQAPPTYTSADLYLQLQKLKVLGSVLYIAAHPDDENTRLLAYLSKGRLYRTGYLALTRGDGGQNLIGDEQGVELGLIRTQELLAARRIDGAEQFFSRAYDFGYTKTTQEALQTWGKEKILSDVVWVIRKFQPDVIVTRFPEDSRAGHGHHSASSVLAHEAFRAAADPTQFPEQFKYGVKPWQARRIMWNTYSFGGNNTIRKDQLRIDVGGYSPILGKSFGEIAAESRSEHKSQGFGVSGSRGQQWEYFSFTEGDRPHSDIMDDVNTSWSRVPGAAGITSQIDSIIARFDLIHPEYSVPALVKLYARIKQLPSGNWTSKKLQEVRDLIENCSGLWMETTTNKEYAVQGDQMRLQVQVDNRLGADISLRELQSGNWDTTLNLSLGTNRNYNWIRLLPVDSTHPISQPYWLVEKKDKGSYNVDNQQLIGKPQNDPAWQVRIRLRINGQDFDYSKPVQYRYTDPVHGELYEPLVIVPPVSVSTDPGLVIFRKQEPAKAPIDIDLAAHRDLQDYTATITRRMKYSNSSLIDSNLTLTAGLKKDYAFTIGNNDMKDLEEDEVLPFAEIRKGREDDAAYLSITSIQYNHIPHIHYFYQDGIKVLNIDLKTVGKKIGYIEGAGDKVPQALEQMGYEVTLLKERDITAANLKSFDAVITGVRAYNVNDFMPEKYSVLMQYVKEGGNLIVQYNTRNFISNIRGQIGPYPFEISRGRVTDEDATVHFLLPRHPVLNYPNKITSKDFEGWIQERGIYFANQADPHYQMPLSMADPNESEQSGSLLIAPYGQGNFVYTGLVFFRELPAGIPGAYRLLANIIALNHKKGF